jgi:hypothetical protein
MSFPKHKPAILDDRRPGSRDDLYNPHFDLDGTRKNWEGIDEARKRWGSIPKTPEEIAEKILSRLNERLSVANWTTQHIDAHTGIQVRIDPKITKNLIWSALRTVRWIKNDATRASVALRINKIREGFKAA